MSQETEVQTEVMPTPWVKPVVERIPLNSAEGKGLNFQADDSVGGSS